MEGENYIKKKKKREKKRGSMGQVNELKIHTNFEKGKKEPSKLWSPNSLSIEHPQKGETQVEKEVRWCYFCISIPWTTNSRVKLASNYWYE